MVKNVIIVLLALIVCVFVTLVFSGRLEWVCGVDVLRGSPEDILERGIEMHRPEVLQMGDQVLLHVPTGSLSGRNWRVGHEFYVFEDGALKHVDFGSASD